MLNKQTISVQNEIEKVQDSKLDFAFINDDQNVYDCPSSAVEEALHDIWNLRCLPMVYVGWENEFETGTIVDIKY